MSPSDRGVHAELRDSGALAGLGLSNDSSFVRLTGHASTRRFYRVGGNRAGVLVVYPEPAAAEEIDRYRRTRDYFAAAGIRVPTIRALGPRALLVEDAGDRMLDDPLEPRLRLRLYRQAATALGRLQHHGVRHSAPNPTMALDANRLGKELEHMDEHALAGWLGQPAGRRARGALYERLVASIARLPTAPCHRDFHARNLMVRDQRLVVVDFQDVMTGPWLYDVASLVDDNYRDVSALERRVFLRSFWERARRTCPVSADAAVPERPRGLPGPARQAFSLLSLQRSLKALGTFGYQVSVAGNEGYARFGARTWRHARRAIERLGWDDALEPLRAFDDLLA